MAAVALCTSGIGSEILKYEDNTGTIGRTDGEGKSLSAPENEPGSAQQPGRPEPTDAQRPGARDCHAYSSPPLFIGDDGDPARPVGGGILL